ncbi:MAG: diadenylate cyclase CdaA [Clostridia bacterium]|nr:diadenylate cyclase CdaA [Clostridia bacterium]
MLDRILSIISVLEFTDVLDILIVFFIASYAVRFIRTTRTWQLGKGLLIIVAVYVLSNVFHLYTVSWLIGNLLSIGLIALVVVFQPELRRALEFLGRGKFATRGFSLEREKYGTTADAITSAIGYFAERREGALIIVENETALQDVAETGTMLDADISTPLLENIFYKGSPLHDGAVILRGDRILAAGCVLPLTENPNLSKDLGTRHRAGIGITEVSDALVLIVSEETGIISMARDGKLSRFLDLKAVEKALLNLYLSKETENKTIFSRLGSTVLQRKEVRDEEPGDN